MSSTWEPPLNCPFVKSAGRIGNFRSSLSWSADGPSPCPVSPWHSQHLALTYSSLPRARSSGVAGGGGGSTTGGSGFSSFHRGERVLMYVMTANRSLSGSSCHVGIAVQRTPRVIVRKRSPSVGSDPDGVERNLKTPMVKSRGRGKRKVAASPLPSPFTPWQPMQCSSNSSLPRAMRSSVCGIPITETATFCGSNTSRHAPRFVPSFWTYRTSPTSSFVGTTRRTDVSAGGLSPKGVRARTGAPWIGSSPPGPERPNTTPDAAHPIDGAPVLYLPP